MSKMEYNLRLTPTGSLRVNTEGMTNYSLVWRLQKIHGLTAMALTTTKSDRQLLQVIMDEYEKQMDMREPRFTVSSEAAESVDEAIEASLTPVPPILPLTPYEKLGAIDELGKLQARTTFGSPSDKTKPHIIKNEMYEIHVSSRKYTRSYSRTKMHVSKQTNNTYTKVHECELNGNDTIFSFSDENKKYFIFREHPDSTYEISEQKMWDYFLEPEIPTIKDLNPEQWEEHNEMLDWLEDMGDGTWKYFQGQRDFLSSFSMLDSGLLAWEMGGGKTLAAFSLFYLKNAKRALFIVPKGTSKGSDGAEVKFNDLPQWLKG